MPLSGRLRRQATTALRRARPAFARLSRKPPASPEVAAHDVEVFSEDFKLLRTLLILLFSLLVIYAGKTVDRWSAATAIHEHLENAFFEAVQSNLLTKPETFYAEGPAGKGLTRTLGRFQIEPDPGAPARMRVDVVAQALQALRAQGLDADHASVNLELPEGAQLSVKVRIGPMQAGLVTELESFHATFKKVAEREGLESNFELLRQTCATQPVGASLRYLPAVEGQGPADPRKLILRMDAPQAEVSLEWMSLTAPRYDTPKLKLLMFHAPDVYQLRRPINCARAYAPGLATWTEPAAPQVKLQAGSLTPDKPARLHADRTDADFNSAREEMEKSSWKLFDVLQLSFDNLFYLFPAVLLVLSAISSSVLRRIALSLPPGVLIGDVLLNRAGSRQPLSMVDGGLVIGVERLVRFLLLTLAIFCPLFVLLSLPVVVGAGHSYSEASQPVVYLYQFARTDDGILWLFPLALALLLCLHQWGLILSPPSAPLARTRAIRWSLLLLVGLPLTAGLLWLGAYFGYAGSANVITSGRAALSGEASQVLVGRSLLAAGLGLALIAAVAGFWFWVLRSPWLGSRRGPRSVIACCVLAVPFQLYFAVRIYGADAHPGSWEILSAVGCALCLWTLYLQLQPRRGLGWRAALIDALMHRLQRLRRRLTRARE